MWQGSLKDTFCNHLKHGFFHTINGNHNLQGNVQVYNVRIPVWPWVKSRTPTKMDKNGWCTYPKNGTIGFDPQPYAKVTPFGLGEFSPRANRQIGPIPGSSPGPRAGGGSFLWSPGRLEPKNPVPNGERVCFFSGDQRNFVFLGKRGLQTPHATKWTNIQKGELVGSPI